MGSLRLLTVPENQLWQRLPGCSPGLSSYKSHQQAQGPGGKGSRSCRGSAGPLPCLILLPAQGCRLPSPRLQLPRPATSLPASRTSMSTQTARPSFPAPPSAATPAGLPAIPHSPLLSRPLQPPLTGLQGSHRSLEPCSPASQPLSLLPPIPATPSAPASALPPQAWARVRPPCPGGQQAPSLSPTPPHPRNYLSD